MTIVATPPSPYDNSVFEQMTEMNLTVEFSDDQEPPMPINVVSAVPEHGGISVTVLDNTITITGKFSGVFDTPISFKTTSGEYKTVKSFNELPTAYDFIYRYAAPLIDAKISKITVTFDDDSTYDYEVVVYYDRAYVATEVFRKKPEPGDIENQWFPALDSGIY